MRGEMDLSKLAGVPLDSKKFLNKLATEFNRAFGDWLSAAASKEGVAPGYVLEKDGTLRKTSFDGFLNEKPAEDAKLIKEFTAAVWNDQVPDDDAVRAFRQAAIALSKHVVLEENLDEFDGEAGSRELVPLYPLEKSAEAFIALLNVHKAVIKPPSTP